ncbi:hypothetical protein BT69DRAFT_1307409 [Atractiella rhizophila]|nr:hypothetical protein BT69DRAFT_1307409 [Atractiella rhizophila]
MLVLYKVSLLDDDLEEGSKNLTFDQDGLLNPMDPLSGIFLEPPVSKHVHIVVDAPPSSQRLAFLRANKSQPPSVAGLLDKFMTRQSSAEKTIYCNRPDTATATIPPTLLHSVFGRFLDECETHKVTADDSVFVLRLCSAMSNFYSKENERAQDIRNLFASSGIHLIPSSIKNYDTDGDISVNGFRYAIAEFKNEIGSTGAEPYGQGCLYYLEGTRDYASDYHRSPLPCMLILLFGPYIAFVGAVWNLRPVIQPLSPALPLHHHRTDDKLRRMVARHLGAFRTAIDALKQYYEKLELDNIKRPKRQRQLFPYPTTFTPVEGGDSLNFEYVFQPHQEKLVFFCIGSEQRELFVKFVRQYSREVHEACASLGCAPKLRGFEALPGGWMMVVMDRLVADEYVELYDATPTSSLIDMIEGKLTELHQRNYVHGDVRETNILVSRHEKEFMLVDFDWAGKIGEARYPMNVNRGPGLWRPDGAKDGELILPNHDMEMLGCIRRGRGLG